LDELVFLMASLEKTTSLGADDLETLLEAVGLKLSPSQMEPRFAQAGCIQWGVFQFYWLCQLQSKILEKIGCRAHGFATRTT